ncbi:hypothetical protein NQ315_006099 [Exocentrus adspersus]|uniref:Nuclease HARBI1 n=1 Tax=Exocentrus adspersus TaxID=1586481 RepID=A0AAV8VE57_9CUCU|nr:hypothetical protein NQ315_006099 [Exocentrus adspersus]
MDYLDYFDWMLYQNADNALRYRIIRERRDPIQLYTELEFRERFGFYKRSVLALLDMVGPYLEHNTNKNFALSPKLQLLCGLRIFRTGTYQIVAGDLMNIHRTTAGRAFHSVVNSLLAIKPLYVSMPSNHEQCLQNKINFHRFGAFPNIIGAIDCVHIPILCPPGDHNEIYRNRKNFFSINTQVISDANMKILNVADPIEPENDNYQFHVEDNAEGNEVRRSIILNYFS